MQQEDRKVTFLCRTLLLNGSLRNVQIARKRCSENEFTVHEKISEHFPHLNENGEIDGVGIIRKLPPENNPNARDVFDTIYCRNGSVEISMINNDAQFRSTMSNQFTFFNSFKNLFVSLDYLLDVLKVSHQAIRAEHIFVTRDFNVKLGGFGEAKIFENDNTISHHYLENLKKFGLLMQKLFNFLFPEHHEEIITLQENHLPMTLGLDNLEYYNDAIVNNNANNSQADEMIERTNHRVILPPETFPDFVKTILTDINAATLDDAKERFSQILEQFMETFRYADREFNVVVSELF